MTLSQLTILDSTRETVARTRHDAKVFFNGNVICTS